MQVELLLYRLLPEGYMCFWLVLVVLVVEVQDILAVQAVAAVVVALVEDIS